MAFGGGNFVDYNKFMPGFYSNTITIGQPVVRQVRGITAGGLAMDWGPDNEVFEMTASEFRDNAVKYTGYSADDDHNILLREVFKHATRFIGYRLNSNGSVKASSKEVGEARCSGEAGNNITVTCYMNVNDDSKYDIGTYFDGILKDIQTVPEASIDEVALTKGAEKAGTAVESADATFAFNKNEITVTFSNVPEGYKPTVRVKGQVGILAFVPGRFEDKELSGGNKHIISYYPGAPINGQMTVEAVLTKDKPTVLKSCTYTCQLNEAVETGADATKLEDNDYVTFNKTGLIPDGAGYVFKGGKTSTTVTAGGHSDLLLAMEGRTFNTLICDTDDTEVKALYLAFTKRLRNERGLYFQTVTYDYADADFEGMISVNNPVILANAPEGVKKSSAVWWVAGYSSAIDLWNELTSKPYDGELTLDTSRPDAQLEILTQRGHFLFHQVSLDEVYTLFDINSLTTFTEDHDKQLKENKVIRIVDYIHNEEAYVINRADIGRTPNSPEGRAAIWNECANILNELQDSGAITDFVDTELTVEEVPGNKHAVKVVQRFRVVGTIYYVYMTTYVVE